MAKNYMIIKTHITVGGGVNAGSGRFAHLASRLSCAGGLGRQGVDAAVGSPQRRGFISVGSYHSL